MMTEVWYLLFNAEKELLVPPFCAKATHIASLKEAVDNGRSSYLKNIDFRQLVIWRCKEPLLSTQEEEDLQECLSKINFLDRKQVVKLASGVDIADLELNAKEVLLVQVPDLSSKKRKIEEEEKPLNKFLSALKHDISNARMAPSPSSVAQELPLFRKEQSKRPVWNGRPFKCHAEPLGLFHPVFNEFQNAITSPEPFLADAATYNLIRRIFYLFSNIYTDEKSRAREIKQPLEILLGMELTVVKSPGVESDGVMTWPCGQILAYLVIQEVKNEIGTAHCDPYNQGSLAYRKYWIDKSRLIGHCCCPSIILAIAGPWLCVIGGIYLDKAITQPLTHYVWLGGNPFDSKELNFAARLFAALKSAILSLKDYYTTLAVDLPYSTIKPYPFITEYGPQKNKFTYLSRLAEDDRYKLVYKARLDGVPNTEIVVKFVERYNARAQCLLADKDLAPKLHYSSIEDNLLFGGRYMIVMDYVDLKPLSSGLTQRQYERVEEAIGILRSHDIVFGDLRPPNILVGGGDCIKIIDFDWCGRAGKDRYPSELNPDESIGWHGEVGPDCLMSTEHDRHMLEKLKNNHVLGI